METQHLRPTKNRFSILQPSSFILPLSTFILLLLSACVATVTPPSPVLIKAAGSTSAQPLLTKLSAAYTAQHPYVTFDIQGGGSHLGQTLVESGQVELGMVSNPLTTVPGNLRLIPLARDAVAIIVHPQNKLPGLSLPELRDIFSGRWPNWQEVKGTPGSIQVVSREDGSGTRATFERVVMEGQAVTPTALVLPSSQAVVDFVAQNPAAIAYASLALVDERVRAIPIEDVTPNLESITSASYSLTRDLAVLALQPGQTEVDNFIEFALSPTGQAVVAEKWGWVR